MREPQDEDDSDRIHRAGKGWSGVQAQCTLREAMALMQDTAAAAEVTLDHSRMRSSNEGCGSTTPAAPTGTAGELSTRPTHCSFNTESLAIYERLLRARKRSCDPDWVPSPLPGDYLDDLASVFAEPYLG